MTSTIFSLMPLLALLVERRHVAQYGSVYAIGRIGSAGTLIYVCTFHKWNICTECKYVRFCPDPTIAGRLKTSFT